MSQHNLIRLQCCRSAKSPDPAARIGGSDVAHSLQSRSSRPNNVGSFNEKPQCSQAVTRNCQHNWTANIAKSIFWSAGRQTDAGSERRRPLAAPVTKKWVGLNRRPMPCLWGLLGRQGLLGAPAAADAAREGRTGTPRGGQGALAEGPGEPWPPGRHRERGRERMRGRSCPGRSAGPAGRRERSGGACDGHDVSSGGGGSAAGSSVSITSMRPRRQAGHCHNGSPVSSS